MLQKPRKVRARFGGIAHQGAPRVYRRQPRLVPRRFRFGDALAVTVPKRNRNARLPP